MMDKLSELVLTHPRLFRGKPPVVASDLPDGWFPIVDALCRGIEALLESEPERLEVSQIKEKFGGLRFYFSLEGAEDMFLDIQTDRGIRTIVGHGDGPPIMEQIRSLALPHPPIAEQEEIAMMLDGKSSCFDSLIKEAENAIALLQERRTALISAAVTGKIDVRHLADAEAA